MRTIINRKIYDTETAEKVAHFDDTDTLTEDLYRTTKGVFFLHGQGGFAPTIGVLLVKGERIRPMSVDEVIDWLEERELLDELEALFPNELEEA